VLDNEPGLRQYEPPTRCDIVAINVSQRNSFAKDGGAHSKTSLGKHWMIWFHTQHAHPEKASVLAAFSCANVHDQ
jgi:hypothetical protein